MDSSLDHPIRDHLGRYISGQSTLQEFDLWFVRATADVDRSGTRAEIDLTYEVFLRLAEYSHGDWTTAELEDLFRALVEAPVTAAVSG